MLVWVQNRRGIGNPGIGNGAKSIEETTGWCRGSTYVVQYHPKSCFRVFKSRCLSYVGDADVLSMSREST